MINLSLDLKSNWILKKAIKIVAPQKFQVSLNFLAKRKTFPQDIIKLCKQKAFQINFNKNKWKTITVTRF